MVKRKNYDAILSQLYREILLMSSVSEEMLRDSIVALKTQDVLLAEDVICRDELVDKKEIEIQELCVRILATQQPVAKDLRKVSAAFKIITNLERIADNAVNISDITIALQSEDYFKELIDIPKLSELAIDLVQMCINSYVDLDISKEREILAIEDQIDNLFSDLHKELILIMVRDPKTIEQATRFIFVARYLERVADHSINIFESVKYIATGIYEDL